MCGWFAESSKNVTHFKKVLFPPRLNTKQSDVTSHFNEKHMISIDYTTVVHIRFTGQGHQGNIPLNLKLCTRIQNNRGRQEAVHVRSVCCEIWKDKLLSPIPERAWCQRACWQPALSLVRRSSPYTHAMLITIETAPEKAGQRLHTI